MSEEGRNEEGGLGEAEYELLLSKRGRKERRQGRIGALQGRRGRKEWKKEG